MLLHPTPTCAAAGPDQQLVLVVFFLPSTSTNIPLAHAVATCFQPLANILHLHLCNLHCVVVVACVGCIPNYCTPLIVHVAVLCNLVECVIHCSGVSCMVMVF